MFNTFSEVKTQSLGKPYTPVFFTSGNLLYRATFKAYMLANEPPKYSSKCMVNIHVFFWRERKRAREKEREREIVYQQLFSVYIKEIQETWGKNSIAISEADQIQHFLQQCLLHDCKHRWHLKGISERGKRGNHNIMGSTSPDTR